MDGVDEPPVTVFSTSNCLECEATKWFLRKRGVAFREVDVAADPAAATLVERLNGGLRSVPTLVAGGRALTMSPFDRARLDDFLRDTGLIGE